jgi:isopentenyl phosphate kinase
LFVATEIHLDKKIVLCVEFLNKKSNFHKYLSMSGSKDAEMSYLTVIKLGGSVITYKDRTPAMINKSVLMRVAEELKSISGNVIVILGGGAHGHQAAHMYGFGDASTPKETLVSGVPVIRHNMTSLSSDVTQILGAQGLPAVVIDPFSFVVLKDGQVEVFPLDVIRQALQEQCLIVTHGDVCLDTVRGASILSGDTIVVTLARQLNAKHVFIGTDVDGIYDSNPSDNRDAKLIPVIDSSNRDDLMDSTGSSKSVDVTGGMHRKLQELLALAADGINIVVFNLTIPGRLSSLLKREPVIGTRILP